MTLAVNFASMKSILLLVFGFLACSPVRADTLIGACFHSSGGVSITQRDSGLYSVDINSGDRVRDWTLWSEHTIVLSSEHLVRSGQLTRAAAAPIVNAAVRIRGLIEEVLDFTRAQSDGVMPLQRTPGDLAVQLGKIVQETQVRHPERTIRVESAGNFAGEWDEGRMGQLLSNLLANALLYGARDSEVRVRMWADARQVCFSVHNRGEAIPEPERERIFRPLERGMAQHLAGERREPSGLGLGLYICREIVRSHGGRLDLASTPAEGTTFTVALPREFAAPPQPRGPAP